MYSAVPYVSVVVFMTIYYSTLSTMSSSFLLFVYYFYNQVLERYYRIDA